MTVNYISLDTTNYASTFTQNVLHSNISATSGDVLLLYVNWRKASATTFSAPLWNGQSLVQQGTTIDEGDAFSALFAVTASSTATASVTGTFSGFIYANSAVLVARSTAGAITISTPLTQFSGVTYAAPSLNLTSVPAGALSLSFLAGLGWDSAFSNVTATTWAQTAPATLRGSVLNTGHQSVTRVYVSSSAATGTVNMAWTPSAGQPSNLHTAVYLYSSSTPLVNSINSGANTVAVGGTVPVSVSNFTTAVNAGTIDGVALSAASSTSLTVNALVDGNTTPRIGTRTLSLSNASAESATLSVSVLPPTNYSSVVLSGTLNTTNTGIIYNFSPAAVVNDVILFPPIPSSGNTTVVDAQGNLNTTFNGTQTFWHIQDSTKIARSYSVITSSGSDVTPDPFTFTDVTNAALSTLYTSNAITVAGVTASVPIAIFVTGGTYNINGGAFTPSSGTVVLGDVVLVRATSSSSPSTNIDTVLSIGGVTDTFSITTASTVPSALTMKSGWYQTQKELAKLTNQLPYQADSTATTLNALIIDYNNLLTKMTNMGWFQ